MSTNTHINNAERFGHWLGRGWCGYMRRERQVAGWLVAQGVPFGVATAMIWIAKLAVLGVLLYAAFWLALLMVFALVASWTARNVEHDEAQPEWRDGLLGFGLYHPDGSRIDPHDPDREMY